MPVLLLIVLISCSGQLDQTLQSSSSSNKVKAIDTLVRAFAEFGEFNGAILVSNQGKVVYKKGFGYANMEWAISNDLDTKFRIGSVTKQFTAMLIMQLAAEEKLDIQATISTYLPEYPKANGERITIHQLLTHSSGIPNNYGSSKQRKDIPGKTIPDNYTPEDLVAAFSGLPLEFTPGEKFSYCNAGYTVLGLIIEKLTGQSYEEALKVRIFNPLGMKNSGFDKHRALIKNKASGHFRSWGVFYNANYVDMSRVYAAGGLYSTIEDLYRWNQALYTEKVLPKSYMDLIFTSHIADDGYGGFYGYGWNMVGKPMGNSGEKIPVIVHDGVIDGFCAIITRIPSTQSSIILLSNVRRAPLNAMTRSIMGIIHDKSYDFPRRSVAYSTLDVINKEGMEEAAAHFDAVKNDEGYFVDENEINSVSYKLLLTDRSDAAAEVLRLGITVFPEAFNLYDSYGEVLRTLGKEEASIANYKKSLELNPNNENAKRVLIEMGIE